MTGRLDLPENNTVCRRDRPEGYPRVYLYLSGLCGLVLKQRDNDGGTGVDNDRMPLIVSDNLPVDW